MINQIEDFFDIKKSNNITIENMIVGTLNAVTNSYFLLLEYQTEMSDDEKVNYLNKISRINCSILFEKVVFWGKFSNIGFTNLSKLSKTNKYNEVLIIREELENISSLSIEDKDYILVRFNARSDIQNLDFTECSILIEIFEELDDTQLNLLDFFNTTLNVSLANEDIQALVLNDTYSISDIRRLINLRLIGNERISLEFDEEIFSDISNVSINFTIPTINDFNYRIDIDEDELLLESILPLNYSSLTNDQFLTLESELSEYGFIFFRFDIQIVLKNTGTVLSFRKQFSVSSIDSPFEDNVQQISTTLARVENLELESRKVMVLSLRNSGNVNISGTLSEILVLLKRGGTTTTLERYDVESSGFRRELDFFNTFRNSSTTMRLEISEDSIILENIDNIYISYILNNNAVISHRILNNANLIDQNISIENITQTFSNSRSFYISGNVEIPNANDITYRNYLFSLVNNQLQELGYSENIESLNQLINKIVFIVTPEIRNDSNESIFLDKIIVSKNSEIEISEPQATFVGYETIVTPETLKDNYNTLELGELSNRLFFGMAINSLKSQLNDFEDAKTVLLKYEIALLPNLSELEDNNRQANIASLTNYIIENGNNVSYTEAIEISTDLVDRENSINLLRFLNRTKFNTYSIVSTELPEVVLEEELDELIDVTNLFTAVSSGNRLVIRLDADPVENQLVGREIRRSFLRLIPEITSLTYSTKDRDNVLVENNEISVRKISRSRSIYITYPGDIYKVFGATFLDLNMTLSNAETTYRIVKRILLRT